MRYKWLLTVLVLSFASVAFAQETATQEPPHWEYTGEEGAEHWGDLEGYELCGTGEAQSPINVTEAIGVALTNIEFSYGESALHIYNNGHTIQVKLDEGSSITYNENTYNLLQFHFHHPSEHTINGEPAAMEIHFVHANDAGNLAVVGVMLQVDDSADNADYGTVFANLPAEKGDPLAETDLSLSLDNMLPAQRTFYTYSGSLTTPPCSQGVRWLLLDTPMLITQAQADAFSAIFEMNARPVQDLNDRDLLQDTTP